MNKLDEILESVQTSKKQLIGELSKHDKTLCDFYHLFELYEFPDDEALKTHKMFVEALHNRRECKRQIELLIKIESKIKSVAKNEKSPRYSPRVINSVFEQYKVYFSQ